MAESFHTRPAYGTSSSYSSLFTPMSDHHLSYSMITPRYSPDTTVAITLRHFEKESKSQAEHEYDDEHGPLPPPPPEDDPSVDPKLPGIHKKKRKVRSAIVSRRKTAIYLEKLESELDMRDSVNASLAKRLAVYTEVISDIRTKIGAMQDKLEGRRESAAKRIRHTSHFEPSVTVPVVSVGGPSDVHNAYYNNPVVSSSQQPGGASHATSLYGGDDRHVSGVATSMPDCALALPAHSDAGAFSAVSAGLHHHHATGANVSVGGGGGAVSATPSDVTSSGGAMCAGGASTAPSTATTSVAPTLFFPDEGAGGLGELYNVANAAEISDEEIVGQSNANVGDCMAFPQYGQPKQHASVFVDNDYTSECSDRQVSPLVRERSHLVESHSRIPGDLIF